MESRSEQRVKEEKVTERKRRVREEEFVETRHRNTDPP